LLLSSQTAFPAAEKGFAVTYFGEFSLLHKFCVDFQIFTVTIMAEERPWLKNYPKGVPANIDPRISSID
jgi:hypothetical protein